MSSLFLLNVYLKKETYDLGKDSNATDFPLNLGSDIFSIKLHKNNSVSVDDSYKKEADFDEAVYFTKVTDETAGPAKEAISRMNDKQREFTKLHIGKVLEQKFKEGVNLTPENANEFLKNLVDKETEKIKVEVTKKAALNEIKHFTQLKYEAILNMNQV